MTLSTPRNRKLIALAALLGLLLALPAVAQDQTPPTTQRTGLMLGLTSSNWDRQATGGLLVEHSKDWSTMYAVDVGGGQLAMQGQALVHLNLNPLTRFSIFAGPEVLVYQEAPTLEQKLTYLNSATGVMLCRQFGPPASAWLALHWNESEAPVAQFKLSFGVILWLQD